MPVDADALAACADEVLWHIQSASKPVLMVDLEVRRFALEEKVAELALRLAQPVVTCFMGRGLLSDSDASLVGTYMGVAGLREVTQLVENSMDIEHTALVAPGYYATMGYGVPAGLGLQAASGQRPLILVGDGAFQMTGWELGNCRRYGWDPIVLLFNDACWEMLRTFQPESRFNVLDTWGFAPMANGLGASGTGHGLRAGPVDCLAVTPDPPRLDDVPRPLDPLDCGAQIDSMK